MVSTTAVSDERWPSPANEAGAARDGVKGALRKGVGFFGDTVLVLLVVWLFPVAIIVLAAPLMLCVRFVLEIAQRL